VQLTDKNVSKIMIFTQKKFWNFSSKSYSVILVDFSSFLPRRLDSQNLKQSIGNFACLPVWVKKKRNLKNSRCIFDEFEGK
jgi:hypothetical protein